MVTPLSILTPKIIACILDIDGVLWKQDQPIVDLSHVLKLFYDQGIAFSFATNNATKTAIQYQEKVSHIFGITIEAWRFITSAEATADYANRLFPSGGPVYVIGGHGLHDALKAKGLLHTKDGSAMAVIVGLDPQVTYDKLTRATILIRSGIPFIGTNPDKTFPSPQGPIPGAGTILAALQAATDVEPTVIGKPKPYMFEVALERMGTPANQTLVIGDRLDTDIRGGINAGCRTALVLSGISSIQDINLSPYKPDLISENICTLLEDG